MSYKLVETKEDMPNSVEISMGASGKYSWSLKVYADGELAEAVEKIKYADGIIRRRFLGEPAPVEKPVVRGPVPVVASEEPDEIELDEEFLFNEEDADEVVEKPKKRGTAPAKKRRARR